MQTNLTTGNVLTTLLRFSLPYLLSCFLQTFYGMADLLIAGQFNGAATISAVSIGSQLMHMLTVILVGLAMGSTVTISRAIGAQKPEEVSHSIGNTITLFLIVSLLLTGLLEFLTTPILTLISTPPEAMQEARAYLMICFAGIPFITAYNVISSIFRGIGDSKSPMYFVAIAGVLNIILDYIFIGPMAMGAAGAALATVISQTCSVLFALAALKRLNLGIHITARDLAFTRGTLEDILRVGIPTACQDGLIQVSFMVITAIANRRGVIVAASVGIVEKIITFLFLVPSAMLSSVSAITAQNAGAGRHDRGEQTLRYAVTVGVTFGLTVAVICQFFAVPMVSLFSGETEVIRLGSEYLRTYVFDCVFAAIHFCFTGYFCAYGKAEYSFLHNVLSIILVRIPGAYLASALFPDTLYPMGLAPALGSVLSAIICAIIYTTRHKKWQQ
jgi:putative MATE family efflux protein